MARGKVPREFLEFQPDNVEIEERPDSRLSRLLLYALLGLLATAVAWASIAEVDRVVTAQGKLIPAEQPIIVQPLDTSVIKVFHVSVGDRVYKGQPLVSLDPTVRQADIGQLQAQRISLAMQAHRLQSELDGKPFKPLGGSLSEEAVLQVQTHQRRMGEHKAYQESYGRRLNALATNLQSIETERRQTKKRLELAQELESMYSAAFKKGASSKVEYLNIQSSRVALETTIDKLEFQLKEVGEERKRVALEKEAFEDNWYSQTLKELLAVRRELDSLDLQLEKARWFNDRGLLRAPADAVVLDLAKRSVGSVVDTAEPVATLVPLDSPLVGEVEVLTRDIGRIRVGDETKMKLEAFPFQQHGALTGRVATISEDAFQKEGTSVPLTVYRVRVNLDPVAMKDVPEDFRLMPGMAITAEIKVGTRKVITYFIYPLLGALDETFREP